MGLDVSISDYCTSTVSVEPVCTANVCYKVMHKCQGIATTAGKSITKSHKKPPQKTYYFLRGGAVHLCVPQI